MQIPTKKPHPAERETASENTRTNFKRFPAFGKQLDDLRKQGRIPAKRVIVAFDWRIGKLFPRIIIMPDAPVTKFQFRYLAGLHIQVAYHDRDAAILPALTDEIMKIHPASLSTFNLSAVKRGEPASHMIYMEEGL
jgi:hypothetical protein